MADPNVPGAEEFIGAVDSNLEQRENDEDGTADANLFLREMLRLLKGWDGFFSQDDALRGLCIELEKISPWYKPLVEFALETGMRRGELMSLLWVNINFEKSVAFLPLTKNGDSRYVPLSSKAIKILKALPRDIEGRVFPLNKQTVSILFLRGARRAKIIDIHFHDLRHIAITRLASKFSNPIEIAAISGHKSLSMLKRYTHIKAEDLVQKLG